MKNATIVAALITVFGAVIAALIGVVPNFTGNGTTVKVEVGSADQPPVVFERSDADVRLLRGCPYCTGFGALVGLDYSPQFPEIVTISLVAAGREMLLGQHCTKVDPVHGRREIGKLNLSGPLTSRTRVQIPIRAQAIGAGCTTLNAEQDGFRSFSLELELTPGQAASTYVSGGLRMARAAIEQLDDESAAQMRDTTLGQMSLSMRDASVALGQRIGDVTYFVNLENPGLFSICESPGGQVPIYNIYTVGPPSFYPL